MLNNFVQSREWKLLREISPELIIGLIGIPIALTYQALSQTIIDDSNLNVAFKPLSLVVSFCYLGALYILLAYLIVDLLHKPLPWRMFRWSLLKRDILKLIGPISVALTLVFIALMGAYGANFLPFTKYSTFVLFSLSLPLIRDTVRGKLLPPNRVFYPYVWALASGCFLCWKTLIESGT